MTIPSPFVLVNVADAGDGKSDDNIEKIASDAFDQAAVEAAREVAVSAPWSAEVAQTLEAIVDAGAIERTAKRLSQLAKFTSERADFQVMPSGLADSAMGISAKALLNQFASSVTAAEIVDTVANARTEFHRIGGVKGLVGILGGLTRRLLAPNLSTHPSEEWLATVAARAAGIVAEQRGEFMKKVFGAEAELAERFIRTLNASALGTVRAKAGVPGLTKELLLTAVFNDLQTGVESRRVGVIDMGAWVTGLGDLINRINVSQDAYTLFDVRTPMPAGMVKSGSAVQAWIREHADELEQPEQAMLVGGEAENQMFMEDFLRAAVPIRQDIGVHTVVGITPARVAGLIRHAGQRKKTLFTDDFSAVQVRDAPDGGDPSWVPGLERVPVALLSTSDLREFASKADRSFEVAIGVLLVGALMVAHTPSMNYHDDTGCVFDSNEGEHRGGIVDVLESLSVCDACQVTLGANARIANAMVEALNQIPRPSARAQEKAE